MLAVVPVRAGALVAGGAECAAECGGRVVLIGDGTEIAAGELAGIASAAICTIETPTFAPAAWTAALAGLVSDDKVVVLPASPDGRDLAPRLAAAVDRPLHAGAVTVTEHGADVARQGGLVIEAIYCDGP